MNIDGQNGLACLSFLKKGDSEPHKIYPLPHMYVLKDLVPDMTNFYQQYKSIKPWLQAGDRNTKEVRAVGRLRPTQHWAVRRRIESGDTHSPGITAVTCYTKHRCGSIRMRGVFN